MFDAIILQCSTNHLYQMCFNHRQHITTSLQVPYISYIIPIHVKHLQFLQNLALPNILSNFSRVVILPSSRTQVLEQAKYLNRLKIHKSLFKVYIRGGSYNIGLVSFHFSIYCPVSTLAMWSINFVLLSTLLSFRSLYFKADKIIITTIIAYISHVNLPSLAKSIHRDIGYYYNILMIKHVFIAVFSILPLSKSIHQAIVSFCCGYFYSVLLYYNCLLPSSRLEACP